MKKYRKILCSIMAGFMIMTAAPGAVPGIACVTEVQAASIGTPKILSAKPSGKKKVIIKWRAVKGAAGYRIMRKTNGGKWQNLKDVSGGSKTGFSDTKVTTGQKYTYTVRAYKKGKKSLSNYNKKGITVIAGLNTLKLNAKTVSVASGNAYDLKISGTRLTPQWKSSNSKVASVSKTGTVTGKKPGTAKITATLGGRKFTAKVTVKKATQSTAQNTQLAGNYAKLKNYITSKGQTDTDGNKMVIETQQEGNTIIVVGLKYFASRDLIDLGVGIKDTDEDVTSAIDVFVNCTKDNTAQAQSVISYQKTSISTLVTFPASSYTRATELVFRYENGAKADKTVQEAANTMMQEGLPYVNITLKARTGLTLKDLGFTSYR